MIKESKNILQTLEPHPHNRDHINFNHYDVWGNVIATSSVIWESPSYTFRIAHDVSCNVWLEGGVWHASIQALDLGFFATPEIAKQVCLKKCLELGFKVFHYSENKNGLE